MRITQWGKKLKARVSEYMTRPRMIIRARSFYSRADLRLYMRKRIALAVFVGVVDLYVWSMVIIQSIPMVEHAMAGESVVISREDSQGDERSSSTEPTPGLPEESTDGTVPAVPHTESEEGSESASAEVSAPSEDSIIDCHSAAKVYATRYGVDENLLHKIINAESGNKPRVENGHSTATGCFQFVIGTWRLYGKRHWGEEFFSKNIYNPAHNTDLAAWAISQYGTGDWDASKHIWSK